MVDEGESVSLYQRCNMCLVETRVKLRISDSEYNTYYYQLLVLLIQ